MKTGNYTSTRFVLGLLIALLTKKWNEDSLEQNLQTLDDLERFQGLVFDRKQRYGGPNYTPTDLEKELRQFSKEIREYIVLQISGVDFESLKSDKNWRLLQVLRNINRYGGYQHDSSLYSDNVDNGISARSSSHLILEILFKRIEAQLKKRFMNKKIYESCMHYLINIRASHNGADAPYQKAELLIIKYGGKDGGKKYLDSVQWDMQPPKYPID